VLAYLARRNFGPIPQPIRSLAMGPLWYEIAVREWEVRERRWTWLRRRATARGVLPATNRVSYIWPAIRCTRPLAPSARPRQPQGRVSGMLGNATPAITLDTYSHVLPNMQDSAVKAIEEAFS
jgi:hypothetical protein